MKRLSLTTTVLLLLAVITITACKKDTPNTSTSIVGTWQLIHYHEVDIDSTTTPITVTTKDTSFVLILKFNSDSSAVAYNDTSLSFGNIGGYNLFSNDSISYVFGPGPPPVRARYTIQDNTLTFFTEPHYLYDSFHCFTTVQTYIRLK